MLNVQSLYPPRRLVPWDTLVYLVFGYFVRDPCLLFCGKSKGVVTGSTPTTLVLTSLFMLIVVVVVCERVANEIRFGTRFKKYIVLWVVLLEDYNINR